MEPWLDDLRHGRAQAAWDSFITRYRPLIVATIRRLVSDDDDAMDVFATVCEVLSADDFARLRRYCERGASSGATSWVVAVVRNVAIDWLRRERGRPRPTIPPALSSLQRDIYRAVCLEGNGHREAYERLASRAAQPLPFATFLKELRETHRLAPWAGRPERRPQQLAHADDASLPFRDAAEAREQRERVAAVLATCADDVRVALLLFVVEGVPADEVARLVGWPNGKAVYNRVYRALAALRGQLARDGLESGDL
jgi:RNA polymerase sigma factor (sigma-70 family)